MKTLTTFAFAIATAFAFGGPAQAGDNAFSEWFCGGVSGCHSGGERSDGSLLDELSIVTPAYATHVGDGFRREFDSWGNTIENWWEGGGGGLNLINDLEAIEEHGSLLDELSIVTPAHAGDQIPCGYFGCDDHHMPPGTFPEVPSRGDLE